MTWHTIRYDRIDALKASWPCHGLPDDFGSLSVETDTGGNIVDIEAYAHRPEGTDEPLAWRDFDGPALKALVEDCVEFGDVCDEPLTDAVRYVLPSSPTP